MLLLVQFGSVVLLAIGMQELTLSDVQPPDPLKHARELTAQKQYAAAETELRAYLETDERSAPARYLLARLFLAENKPTDALAEFNHAARIEPPSSADLLDVARAYVLLDDYPDAQKWLESAVARNPANEEAWYSLGRVRYTNQEFQTSLEAFEHALALAPRDVRAENNRGLALDALNRTEEAIAAYRRALSWQTPETPQPEQPMINLATALIRRGDTAEALPLLQRAEAVAPASPAVRESIEEQLGHLYLRQNRLPEAGTAFEQALALSPGSSALHFLLGQTYRRMGLKEKADEQFRQSAALAGSHSTDRK